MTGLIIMQSLNPEFKGDVTHQYGVTGFESLAA
jgi:hypothetical protein